MAMVFRKVVTNDLFSENEVSNVHSPEVLSTHYARPRLEGRPRLGAVTFLTVDTEMDRDLSAMHQRCVEEAVATIWQTGWSAHMVLIDAPWQPKSVMVRYKRLWKRYSQIQGFDPAQLSEEVMVESQEGLRFGGVVQLTKDSFWLASQIVWEEFHSAFLIISRTNDYMNVATIRQLMDFAFPEVNGKWDSQVDLLNVCHHICPRGDAIGRVTGDWDSRDIAIDLIMQPEYLQEFG